MLWEILQRKTAGQKMMTLRGMAMNRGESPDRQHYLYAALRIIQARLDSSSLSPLQPNATKREQTQTRVLARRR